MDVRDLDVLYPVVDIFQIGSRNMQNYVLLEEMGRIDKPVMLKGAFPQPSKNGSWPLSIS
jgi:3-deoxy-7-phosphoheptulonate synthase